MAHACGTRAEKTPLHKVVAGAVRAVNYMLPHGFDTGHIDGGLSVDGGFDVIEVGAGRVALSARGTGTTYAVAEKVGDTVRLWSDHPDVPGAALISVEDVGGLSETGGYRRVAGAVLYVCATEIARRAAEGDGQPFLCRVAATLCARYEAISRHVVGAELDFRRSYPLPEDVLVTFDDAANQYARKGYASSGPVRRFLYDLGL